MRARRAVVSLFAVGLAACAPACGSTPRVRAPGERWLAAIRIDGNRAIPDDELLPRLALDGERAAGRAIDPYQLELDTRRIRGAYLRLGFFDVKVASRVTGAPGQTLTFSVDEGRRATTRLAISGLPPEVGEGRARARIELADGAPFDYERYDDAKAPLLALVRDAGYAHAMLDARVDADRAAGVAGVRYAFAPGPRARFGAIAIRGAEQFPDLERAIRERCAFAAGDPYSDRAQATTQRAVAELGRFSTVDIEPDRSGGGELVPVTISVVLANRHEVKLGGGFGYEEATFEGRTRADLSLIPARHPLWSLQAAARLAATVVESPDGRAIQPKIRVLGTADRLDLAVPQLRGELAAGVDYVTVEAYTSTGPLARLGASYPVRSWLRVRAGWQAQLLAFRGVADFVDPDQEARLGLDRAARLGAFQQAVVADLRDDPIEPHRGGYLDLRISEGTRFAGGAFDYLQITPDLRGYVPLGDHIVLAARLRGGTMLGDVPATERYYAGGAQSHRGFSGRRLSPTALAVDPDTGAMVPVVIGGAAVIEAGVELRMPFGELGGFELGGTAFLDGGDVTDRADDLDPTNLHWAAGGGLSLRVAGIKVRVDVGYRLNRLGPDEPDPGSRVAVLLGVGETY